MAEPELPRTEPRKSELKGIPKDQLVGGRYGTPEMCEVFGPDKTVESILEVQATVASVVSKHYPKKLPPEAAAEIRRKATLQYVDPDEVAAEEDRTGHDVLGVTNTLTRALEPFARPHVGEYMTSADSTETGKALRIKRGLEILIGSAENLRDIVIEKTVEWKDIPHIQNTHLLDAVPEAFGRSFANYAERIQIRINEMKYVYDNLIYGKYSDATGSYHQASAVGVDGRKLEEDLCKELGIKHMIASSQVPAREFLTDIVFAVTQYATVVADLAHHIRWLKSDDVDCLIEKKKKKGSSAMPHKDRKGGNPTAEEQAESVAYELIGGVVTMLCANRMDYGRDLSGSLSDRIRIDEAFKLTDHATRRMASCVYRLKPNMERIKERMQRTFDITTSSRILTYLTDPEMVQNPMAREEAHDLLGKLATAAYDERKPFSEILSKNEKITSRLSHEKIVELSDPFTYLGESKAIIDDVHKAYHRKKTFEKAA